MAGRCSIMAAKRCIVWQDRYNPGEQGREFHQKDFQNRIKYRPKNPLQFYIKGMLLLILSLRTPKLVDSKFVEYFENNRFMRIRILPNLNIVFYENVFYSLLTYRNELIILESGDKS